MEHAGISESNEIYLQFQALVSDIVSVVHHLLIAHGHQDTSRHGRHKNRLCSEVQAVDWNMREDNRCKSLQGFFPGRSPWTDNSSIHFDPTSYVLKSLMTGEHPKFCCVL